MTATRVNGFSPWAIGAISPIPTAVQTQKFVAHIGVPAWLLAEIVILSLVTVATGTTVAVWINRRKRN